MTVPHDSCARESTSCSVRGPSVAHVAAWASWSVVHRQRTVLLRADGSRTS